ncbi:hypothetical protein BGX28_003690 [Mortierella sp. GBA30]|nr:hypothetical protein BGX28_003690 [Mortierella sp. GBA30]
MEPTSRERPRPARTGLRRPNYGPMAQALKSSSSSSTSSSMRRTLMDLELFEQMRLTSIEVQSSATRQSVIEKNVFMSNNGDQGHQQNQQQQNQQLEQQPVLMESFGESRKRTTSLNEPQEGMIESVYLPTTPKKLKTGLRRPNIGAMGEVIFGKDSTAEPTTTRRTVPDEDLLDVLNLNRPTGHHPSGRDQDNRANETLYTERADDIAGYVTDPQTPRRESTAVYATPRRRTPRRRSKPTNSNVKPSAFKAMADAHQARMNKLIYEATRIGQAGREKHSPMNILRALSRVPGFVQPRKPSPERQPIPGSAQWKKLTPKTPRTQHIQVSSQKNRIPTAPDFGTSSHSSSKSLDRNAMSAEQQAAFDRFRDNNPFLDPEEFNKLWEDETGIGRNKRLSGRGSFGTVLFGEGYGDERMLLEEDGDTRDLHQLQAQADITDPFLSQLELEERPPHLEDLTMGSHHGMLEDEQDQQQQEQHRLALAADQPEREARYQDIRKGAEDSASAISTDLGTLSAISEPPGVTLELSAGRLGSEEGLTIPTDRSTEERETLELANAEAEALGEDQFGDHGELLVDQSKEHPVDENMDEEGWEDIPDEENEAGLLHLQQQSTVEITEPTVSEEVAVDNMDMNVDQQENEQEFVIQEDQMIDHQGQEQEQGQVPELDVEDQQDAETDLAREAQEDQQEYDDGYVNQNEDHVELQEHEERQRQGPSGTQYFDDFPSELGIMSNGEVLPTVFPKAKKTVRMSKAGIPVPSMPTALQKQHVHTFSRSRVSQEAMSVIMEGSHQFLEQASNDLAAYAEHAGRRTIDESDVELLMDRLRLTNEKVSLESLLHRYLPRELRDKVLYPDEMQQFRRL